MDPSSLTLYCQTKNNTWEETTPITGNGRTRRSCQTYYDLATLSPCAAPSNTLTPTTLMADKTSGLHQAASIQYTLPVHPQLTKISKTLSDNLLKEPFYNQLLGPVKEIESHGQAIAATLKSGTLHICTDGSFDPAPKLGSHGWVFSDSLSEIWAGAGPADGLQTLMPPYRAELSGILAGLHILSSVCTTYSISSSSIYFYCDCEKAIKNIKHKTYSSIKAQLVSDHDLLHDIREILHILPVKPCKDIP
jgi:hypothetical protein